MLPTPAPVPDGEPAWTVSVSPAQLRLLQACVSWLLQVQRDPAIGQRLADVRWTLLRARPIRAETRPRLGVDARPPRRTVPC